ncbi:MAG: hypothetical protein ABL912_04480 [Novosphingobium sp.]
MLVRNGWLTRGIELAEPPKRWLARWRGPIVIMAMVLFLAGSIWSFLGLGLSLEELNLTALFVLLVPMGLAMIVYSAIALCLLARTAGVPLGMVQAMRATAHAQLAEALPIPGGAIVRAAALVSAGASAQTSAALVIGTALLWIALAGIAAGAILLPLTGGWLLIGGGSVIVAAALFHLVRLGGITNAVLTLLHRSLGLGLAAVRLWLSFAVVKAVLPLVATFPYVLAAIAGSASSLVPGGLGVSEALGSLMAQAIHASPTAAFLALAVNRVTQFLGTALFWPLLEYRRKHER